MTRRQIDKGQIVMSQRFSIALSGMCGLLMTAVPVAAQSTPEWSRPPQRAEWRQQFRDARQGPEDTERLSRTIKVGRGGSLELSNISGDIVVSGGGGDEMTIDAVKHARSRDGSAKQLLSDLTIDIFERGGRVEVRTNYPRGSGSHSAWVDYTVKVPNEAGVSLRTISGDVRVTNVQGEIRVESVSGDVYASGVPRLALAKSVSGDVDVSGAASEGELTVSTVSGGLVGKGLRARSVAANTVSGDLILTDVSCDRAVVHSVSGDMEYTGTIARNGRYELNSHSGDVRFTAGQGTGFEVDATSFSGSVRADLPLNLAARDDDRWSRHESRSIRGTVGDGSAVIEISTFSGDITIAKR